MLEKRVSGGKVRLNSVIYNRYSKLTVRVWDLIKSNFLAQENALLTKLVRSRWLDIGQVLFFAFLWTETKSRSIKTQKKNEANIQPS